MKYRFMLKPLAVALHAAALGAALLASAPLAAQETAPAVARDYQIASGPLAAVLASFAAQAGISLSFEPALASGKTSPGLSGRAGLHEAFARLLSGTGLEAVPTVEGGYSLRALPAPSADGASLLQAVKVEATTRDPTVTEGTRSYAAKVVTAGGKQPREPRQIQQSVSVITAQRARDQVLTTAEEALRQATGVTLVQGTGYTTNAGFSSRGFAMGVQTDGGAVSVNNIWYHTGLPDMAILDHIEVLRGSDGLFAGSGAPGGTVNLVRKQPLDHQQVKFDVLAASWDRYRSEVDVSTPLGWNGALRGRFVAAEEKRHYFYDTVSSEKTVLYGVLAADLSDSTLLTTGMSYEQMDRNGLFYGLPRYSTGADLKLPRSSCLCTGWSGRDDETRELYARLEQNLGAQWRFKLNLSQQWLSYGYTQGNAQGAVSPASGSGALLSGQRTDVANTAKLADFTLDGTFTVLGLQQELMVGWNWQDMYSDGSGVSLYATRPAVDVFDFDAADFAQPGVPSTYIPRKPFGGQKQSGTYLTLRSEWFEGMHSIIGIRNSNFDNNYTAGNLYTKDRNVRTPYAGLSYDVSQTTTLYGSYAQIYAPQSYSIMESGGTVKPIEGDTYEAGIKSSWLDGALAASLAVYQAERSNIAVRVSTSPTSNYCCYTAGAKTESRGVDAELVGELLAGWQLQLGYTFNLNEYKAGYGTTTGSRLSPTTPKHLLKLWSMLQLRGDWSKLRVGGGVNWQSDVYVNGTAATYNADSDEYDGPAVPFKYTQNAHAVAGLRADYQLTPQWALGLNVNNLFDERYYQTVATSTGGNYYGEPRNWILSLSGRW